MIENKIAMDSEEDSAGLGIKEAIKEANRCLNCKVPQCKEGCPISNDIPEFIAALGHGNIGEASKVIARKSNLPAVCGRVCAHELQCEGHCILTKAGKGIRVGQLERFIADFAFQMALPLDGVPQKTRGKVAVIGSGPAGLTVAGDLAKIGFGVTVYESLPEPGGIMLYGIPAFRLPKEIVRREIVRIEALGVKIICNSMVGRDTTVDQMFEEGFDAVFIGSGTAVAKDLDLPGKELNGIIQSSYLLRMNTLFNEGQLGREEVPVSKGDEVLVIGAGNVGMDAARTAIRLGAASVTVLYRGQQDKMPALKAEYEAALADGVKFMWNVTPTAYEGTDGKFFGLRVNRDGEDTMLPANKVFLAVGSKPANRIVSTTTGIDVDKDGYVISRQRPYGMTTRKGVFAGGDVVHRPATVVLAMKEAKQVAVGIAEYIDAVKLLEL
ncbi:NAD(P)-dependent oxidoreductase [Ruminococcaceae bacterium OttesenSCG-928-A16]|nr:NAD(P)-dependent oxidoreductase [Ruminococcaceae bacterium OttesenSCG-928-A16]